MSRRAALLVLALLLPAAARAEDPPPAAAAASPAVDLPVALEMTLGFANRIPADGFVSVSVDVTNRGPAANALVTIRGHETGNVLLRLGPVDLEAGARRRLVGVVPARPVAESPTLLVTASDALLEERVLGQSVVSVDPTSSRVLVALDRRGGAPSDLTTLRTLDGQTAGGQPAEVRWTAILSSRLEDLPQSPLGYSGLHAVLLGDLDLEGWPEPEARALAAWVARGGNLIITVGPRARLLRGRSLLGKFLGPALRPLPDEPPARDVALDELVRGLRGTYGLDAPEGGVPPAPAVAALLPAPEDAVLLRAGDRPFVVRRRHGLGRVTLVAADLWAPPFLHSPVTTRLLETLLVEGTQHAPRARMLFRELAEVRQAARVGPAFAMLLLYALIAGPGVYFVLRAKKRGILLWVVIPAGTVLCTALVPLYRVMLRDAESTLVGVRLIEGWAGQPLTVETADVVLFSGSLEPKRFEYAGADAVAFGVQPPRRRQGGPEMGNVLGGGPEGAAFSLPVALWGTRYVSFESTGGALASVEGGVGLSFPGLDADPGAEPAARVRLRWNGPTLSDGVVVFPGSSGPLAHRLGRELAPGDELDEPALPIPGQSLGASGTDFAATILEQVLGARVLGTVELERTAFLVGQVDAPPPVRALPNVRPRAFVHVVVFELPVSYVDAIPFGVARAVREGSTVAAVSSGAVEREQRTRLQLPSAQGREVAKAKLRVTAQRQRSVLRLRVDVYDWRTGDWLALLPREDGDEERDGTLRRLELPLEDAGRHVSPDGVVLLRQRFLRGRQDSDDAAAALLDVSVEWVRRE